MASDNSPPRIQPIVITALIAVVTLIGLKFAFDSYYLVMFEGEEYRKVGSVQPTELLALRAAEKKSFSKAPIPIDRAMDLVARGREAPMFDLKDGDVTPRQSTDLAALVGWAQAPRMVLAPAAAPTDSAVPPSNAATPAASNGATPVPPPGSAPASAPGASGTVAPPPTPSAKPAGSSSAAPPVNTPGAAPSAHP